MMRIKNLITRVLIVFLCLIYTDSFAQETENVSQYRLGVEMNWKLFNVKGLKLSVEPQFRFEDGFSYESFQVEPALQYKTLGFLYFQAIYRLTFTPSEDKSGPTTYGRYGFSVAVKEDFGRFTPSFRALYSNYTDDDIDDKKYMRYRAKLGYNIKKCPLSPYVLSELYHNVSENYINKTRYSAGTEFKIKKNNYLDFNYKFEYYTRKYKNRHIFSLGYKVDF